MTPWRCECGALNNAAGACRNCHKTPTWILGGRGYGNLDEISPGPDPDRLLETINKVERLVTLREKHTARLTALAIILGVLTLALALSLLIGD